MSKATKCHREAALEAMHPLVHHRTWWAHRWLEHGDQFDEGMAMRVAQALAEAEQRGAEAERLRAARWLEAEGLSGGAAIRAGRHLEDGE